MIDSPKKLALYFGCLEKTGHYLHGPSGLCSIDAKRDVPGIPWGIDIMDGKLLKNGKHEDDDTGRVFWTCAGKSELWFAFFWWDNSVDQRTGSNSGFYVRGFEFCDLKDAFQFACESWPSVVSRQRNKLELQIGAP